MINLLGFLVTTALITAAIPVALLLAPAVYLAVVAYGAGYGEHGALGAGALGFIYTVVVLHAVHSTAGLILLLAVAPGVMGLAMRHSPKQ